MGFSKQWLSFTLSLKNFYCLIIYLFSFFIEAGAKDYIYQKNWPTLNLFGTTGILYTPSAEIGQAGDLFFSFSKNDIYKYGAITISPFNWLEASYFYYRPVDIWWKGESTAGKYLDKGFNLKINKSFGSNKTIAIGLDDIAGTGYFTKEYLVATWAAPHQARFSLGMGWGAFVGKKTYPNPLRFLASEFEFRSTNSSNYQEGGSLSYDQFFRGPVSFFGGIEYNVPHLNGLKLKIEYNPYDFVSGFTGLSRQGVNSFLRKDDSDINFGFVYDFNRNSSISVAYLKGNTLDISFKIGGNFGKAFFKKRLPKNNLISSANKGTNAKERFHEDLLLNLQSKRIYLQTSDLSNKDAKIAVSSNVYQNPIYIHSLVGETVYDISNASNEIDIEKVTTININVGTELNRITSPLEYFKNTQNSITEVVIEESIVSRGENNKFEEFEFRPLIKFPALFTGIAPALVNHIGDPQRFYYGGLVIRMDNEIQLSKKLQINSEINHRIFDNFDEKNNFPDSQLPHVRTDIVSYLQESNTYITRMQLDYFFNLYPELFGKFSTGILEDMYVGGGFEFLYKPFQQNISIGLEAYEVKKRGFDRKFDLLDFHTTTGHVNFNYHFPRWGILGTLSYGKYLAGDKGYTFDISRRLSSGFRAGIFFTRTDVSAELFGEGSFDKGFYFQIPIDLFLNDYRGGYINFKLRPLTRDGGQKLEAGNDLIGIMHSTSRAEIERDWGAFND